MCAPAKPIEAAPCTLPNEDGPERGGLELLFIKARVFDLADLIEETAEMLRPKAREKGLDLVVRGYLTIMDIVG